MSSQHLYNYISGTSSGDRGNVLAFLTKAFSRRKHIGEK